MRRLVRAVAVALVLWNVALVALSWALGALAEREHPPAGQFVEVGERRVHVRDFGAPASDPSAPTLLLLHGASTSLLDFEHVLAPALAATFRVVTVDRPGHGYSERGDTASTADSPEGAWPDPYVQAAVARAALESVGVDEAVWVGHSWAGAVVLAALLDEADHARAGVLLGGVSHPWENAFPPHVEIAARPLIGLPFTWQYVAPIGRLALDDALASVFDPEAVPAGYAARTGVTLSLRPAAWRANAIDRTRLSAHLERQSVRYPSIEQPVLSIVGTADDIVPARNHDERLVEQLSTMRSVALEGAGHAFHHTRTERVAALVAEFVRNLPAE